jgi:hypothetical protein
VTPPWPFFSSDEFLQVLADVYFPGAEPGLVACEGQVFRTLVDGHEEVPRFWQFPFYVEPLTNVPPGATPRTVPMVERTVVRELAAEGLEAESGQSAPFIRWSGFADWEAFGKHVAAPGRNGRWHSMERHERRLRRDHGPIEFRTEDDDPAALDSLLRWKALFYQLHRLVDRFTDPRATTFFHELSRRGLARVSTLRANGVVVAGAVTHRWNRGVHSRLIAHDTSLDWYSPGSLAVFKLLRDSYDAGDEQYDFLIGRHTYKLGYATHERALATVGHLPARQRLMQRLRDVAGPRLALRRERRAEDLAASRADVCGANE